MTLSSESGFKVMIDPLGQRACWTPGPGGSASRRLLGGIEAIGPECSAARRTG
jgi:hypothetical protein